jgi:transposase-like protein
MERKQPQSLKEAITYFSDADRTFEFAKLLRWPDGVVVCPRCGAAKNSFLKTRRMWFCYSCKKQFSIKVSTIFEDSAIGLDKWMTAIWMLVNCRNGISSWELHRTLGVTQKTAWFMLQRIRRALHNGSLDKMGGNHGPVEADETYVGGLAKNMHAADRARKIRGSGGKDKTIVMGFLDRNAREVRAKVIPNVRRETLQAEVLANVDKRARVYTDSFLGYNGLAARFYVHEMVDHLRTYVDGQIHTNGMENFWSLLKRGLRGTYVAVEPFHLSRYVDEQVFRYNHRKDDNGVKLTDFDRFQTAMSQIVSKRLTYSELTGKSDSPHHAETGAGAEVPF